MAYLTWRVALPLLALLAGVCLAAMAFGYLFHIGWSLYQPASPS